MGGSRSQSRRLSLRAPLSPSPYIYIIPHFCGFVKRFSKKFATFLEKAFVQEKVQFLFTSCRLGFLHRPNLLTHTSCPLDTYIIPHFSVFVKGFFKSFWKIFSLVYLQFMLGGLEPHYHSRMLSLAPWHLYYIIILFICQYGKLHKFLSVLRGTFVQNAEGARARKNRPIRDGFAYHSLCDGSPVCENTHLPHG